MDDPVGETSSVNQSAINGETSFVNQSAINGSTSCSQVDISGQPFFMLVYSLVFLVGLVLNGFTLKVYFCRAQQKASSSVTVYMKNLAAADFFLSLCLPIRIANFASNSVRVHQVYCHYGAAAFYLNMYASILFMGYIAANRYLKIVHPLGTHILQQVRGAVIISAVTWVSLLASTGTYVTLSLVTQPTETSVPAAVGCESLHSPQLRLLYIIIHSFSAIIFFSVLISLVFFYYSITRRLMLVQQKQQGGAASSGCKRLVRSRRNMLVLVSVFCVCFVPYHLVRLPYAFLRERCTLFFYLKEVAIMVSVLNVCLDPLIYFIFCEAFRAQLSQTRVFNISQVVTHAPSEERRASQGHLSTPKIEKMASFSMRTRQNTVF
ncbi:P2Y purinoceptor 14-like [Diretmus argenteus]